MAKAKSTKRSTRLSVAKDLAKQTVHTHKQALLMAKYIQLKEYATSLNLSLVSIRLQEAHKAAESADQQKFESLARGIWNTLEGRYNPISAARKKLLVPNLSTPTLLIQAPVAAHGESQTSIGSIGSTGSQQSAF